MATEYTKLSFSFSPEDYKILAKIKKTLEPTHGKLSNMTVIRIALRKMAA